MDLTKNNGTPLSSSEQPNSHYLYNDTSHLLKFDWITPLEDIRSKLRWALSFHAFVFGCAFFILAFYTFFSLLNIRSQISKKRFMSGINTFLCIFSLSRAASLLIDTYGSLKVLPISISNLIWAIGFPSLMSSLLLFQLAFLHLTKLKFGSGFVREEIFMRSLLIIHIFSTVLRVFIWTLNRSFLIVTINYFWEMLFSMWAAGLHYTFFHYIRQAFKLVNRLPNTILKRDGCESEGVMILEMIAPASNFVSSVTAALMPTLLGPAANLTPNKPNSAQQTNVNGSEKKEPLNIVSPSTSAAPRLGGQLKQSRTKVTEDLRTVVIKEGSTRTKKLTWQSSIANENQTESNIVTSKITSNTPTMKKPILKDVNKPELPKVDVTKPAADVSEPVTEISADFNESAAKDNDILLRTILHHIAYVNRASGSSDYTLGACPHSLTPTSLRKQICIILRLTYAITAAGFFLSLAEIFQRVGPYGAMKYLLRIEETDPWPWFAFQNVCRACEIFVSIAIANLTKQTSSGIPRHYKHNPAIMKQRGSMFM